MSGYMRFVLMLCVMVCLLFFGGLSVSGAPDDPPYRVFILHSYESDDVCGQPQHDGVVSALKKAGMDDPKTAGVQAFFMETKRKNHTEKLIWEQARIAMERIRAIQPHVVVTLDDNAFRTVALSLTDTPIPVVFCGLNGQPETYNREKPFMESRERPGHNITGVYEKLHFVNAVRVHTRLFPKTRKIMIFSDPSVTGRAILNQITLEIAQEPLPCAHEIQVVQTWEAYKDAILKANQDPEVGVIYPAALLLKDHEGKIYTAPEIFAWTKKNSSHPELAINYAFIKMGLFGGAAVDFHAMGEQAGRMAVRILQGEAPGHIPIEEAERYALVFNLDRARELHIQIPPDVLLAADEVIIDKSRARAGHQ